MNILLIYPKYPDTYWSFKHALKFVSKKASNVPLGMLTIASLMPADWNKKLIDLNVTELDDDSLIWADLVFIGAMSVQMDSVKRTIQRCKLVHMKIVAGGPLFTEEYDLFPDIDYLVLNEAEITLPRFIADFQRDQAHRIYQTEEFADLSNTPLPDYSLIELKNYVTAGIQYSRGCPFDCEFCDITALFGRKVRTKSSGQIVAELDTLLLQGWKGGVFFVDDNFIGHKQSLKTELLPVMIKWMKTHQYPFHFITEASVNLADDDELMNLMVQAGFDKVFVGIETVEENSLIECNKIQNKKRNLLQSVHSIQEAGIEVFAGFIVGFDNDPPSIFQRQIDFIQQSGIITAMVGLLNAPRHSKLYKRLQQEGRIVDTFHGDNTNYAMNFTPSMDKDLLMNGYQKIIHDIYSSKSYYERVMVFLKKYRPPIKGKGKMSFNKLLAFLKSIYYIGIVKKNQKYFWNLFFWCLFNKPKSLPLAITYSIYGYHFRKVFKGLN